MTSDLALRADVFAIIEDARARQEAVVQLTLFNDSKAMQFLGLYTTLALAAAGAALSGLARDAALGPAAVAGFLAATAMLLAGAYNCLLSIAPSMVELQGEAPGWWKWQLEHSASVDAALREYLERLEKGIETNRRVLRTGNAYLQRARRAAIFAPLFGAASGLAWAAATWWLP